MGTATPLPIANSAASGPISLLADLVVQGEGAPRGPAQRALRVLSGLGAVVHFEAGDSECLVNIRDGAMVSISALPPIGPMAVAAEYAGITAATLLVTRRPKTLVAAHVRAGLVEGAVRAVACHPVRCADGWLVARWHDASERQLLENLLGRPLERSARRDIWTAASECRLLVAPILERPRGLGVFPRFTASPSARGHGESRIVDWSNLWAGPWAAGQLAARGHPVTRLEAPGRPDGLLGTADGERIWRTFNDGKTLERLDGRSRDGNRRIRELLEGADLLIDGNTSRVRDNLRVGDDWLADHAPRLGIISIRAFDGLEASAPGLGDMASAVAGLLVPSLGEAPDLAPWADPLGGAWVLLVAEAWSHAGRPAGLRATVSLESAASPAHYDWPLPFSADVAYPSPTSVGVKKQDR
jgi:hypothetical protein